jgi:hypothetical protein
LEEERYPTSLSYDEQRQLDPKVDSWILLAEGAALSAPTLSAKMVRKNLKFRTHMWKSEAKFWRACTLKVACRYATQEFRKGRNGRRPGYSFAGTTRTCRHCFEGLMGCTNMIATFGNHSDGMIEDSGDLEME